MKCLRNIDNKDMKAERKKIIAEYLRFMISGKEIKGRSWRNRPASKFYEYLRRDADLYNCSVMDVLYRDAQWFNGVFIDLTKLDKKERINQVINEVVSLELDLTVENVYMQSLATPGGTLFNCDEEVKECIILYIIGLMKDHNVFANLANIRTQLEFIKLDASDEFIYKCMRVEYLGRPLVDGVSYEIADNKIKIVCPHTNYINITRHEKISLECILSMINEMDAIRKADKRIKVKGISTIRKRVKDAYKLYLIDWSVYDETFNKCIELAKQVEREGLHLGTSDDTVLKELTESRFVIDRLGYRGTNYSIMLDLNFSVKSALNACRAIGSDCLGIKINI